MPRRIYAVHWRALVRAYLSMPRSSSCYVPYLCRVLVDGSFKRLVVFSYLCRAVARTHMCCAIRARPYAPRYYARLLMPRFKPRTFPCFLAVYYIYAESLSLGR